MRSMTLWPRHIHINTHHTPALFAVCAAFIRLHLSSHGVGRSSFWVWVDWHYFILLLSAAVFLLGMRSPHKIGLLLTFQWAMGHWGCHTINHVFAPTDALFNQNILFFSWFLQGCSSVDVQFCLLKECFCVSILNSWECMKYMVLWPE
jgi:hypothetical protein